MSKLNHYRIAELLHSQVVGHVNFGHGQIASLGDAQRYFDSRHLNEPTAVVHADEDVDWTLVKQAFLEVRKDRKSSEVYVADPDKNAIFLRRCRKLGVKASDYTINTTLYNARKNRLLTGLNSERTSSHHESFAFACEFAATELRYTKGVSIDDIICDPLLAAAFDAIAGRISPGHTSFEYRWGILSIRKASGSKQLGRKASGSKKKVAIAASFTPIEMPDLTKGFRLIIDPLETIPEESGVYVLSERENPIYAAGTESLRQGVSLYRQPNVFAAITDKFWRPKQDEFTVAYATVLQSSKLKGIEQKLIEEWQPVFNVARIAI